MTVKELIAVIDERMEVEHKRVAALKEKTYTGFEITVHAKDGQFLCEHMGAYRALKELKLALLLSQEK